jgi:signal transduction histidine kinase
MEMKRSKNNTWLFILMIISQIMLTGLLVQWLRSQWNDEKESFQKDINRKFLDCVDQVMDSMLVKHLIVPVLHDTVANKEVAKGIIRMKPADGLKESQHITAFINDRNGQKHTMVTITLPDTGKTARRNDIEFSTYDSTEKKMLLRSVKLIIRQTEDSVGKKNRFDHIISIVPDTILLKKLLINKLGSQDASFKILWLADSSKNKSDIKGPVMYFKTNLFEKPLHVEIIHYQGAILKSILAQILFALVLLISTGAAFFFTYRNLRKQEALNDLRNDFINNISHELKTPVSTVSVALEALKTFDRKNDPAKSDEYLDIAFSEMKRLDQLISQILNTSILEDNAGYLKPEDADLVSLTKDVLNSMQVRFVQRKARVEFSASQEKITLRLDKLHIQGVLINILDNSLKYCRENPVIQVTLEQGKNEVYLKISDNGPGIPKEYLLKVFDKFFRVPKGDIHNIKGYGLGLSFADMVMKNHSGSISVRNKDEGGCEFTLIFKGEQA